MGFNEKEQQLFDSMSDAPPASNAAGGGATGALVTDGATHGDSPYTAIPSSPLNMVDQFEMGWARKPKEQEKLLRSKFDDVELVPNADGGSQFAVKDKDGKWYQANPAFHWTNSAAGIPVPDVDNHNIKKLGAAISQDAGEYGLRAFAAMTAGGATLSAMSPLAATGPAGVVAAGTAALAAAGTAATSAEALDMASRKFFSSKDQPGAGVVPQTPEELQQQLAGSALFGMQTFATGKALEFAGSSAAKKMGNLLGTLTDNPESRQTARKLLTMMGSDDRLADARLQNPLRTSRYDEMVSRFPENPHIKAPIDHAEDAAVSRLNDETNGVLRRAQAEFGALEQMPGVKNFRADNNQVVGAALDSLKQARILMDRDKVNPATVLGDGDAKAVNYIKGLMSRAGDMSYQDLRAEYSNIRNLFENGVSHPQLKRVLQQLKVGLNDSVVQNLPEDTVPVYTNLMKKYGPITEMADEMAGVDSSNKKLKWASKILSDNRNDAKELVDSMMNAGIDPDAYYNYMQVQAAKQSKDWFRPGKLVKKIPAPNPEKFSQAVGGMHNAAQSLPYADKTLKFLKGLSDEQFKQVMTNPQMFDQVAGMAAGAGATEKQSTDSLMQGVDNQ